MTTNIPNPDKVRIKLIRNTKGYGWEISAGGDTPTEVKLIIEKLDSWLKQNYASQDSTNEVK